MKWMKAVIDHVTKTRSTTLTADLETGVLTAGASAVKVNADGSLDKGAWTYDDKTGSWTNTETGEVFNEANKTGGKDAKEDEGKESWTYDEAKKAWVNTKTGETVADGQKATHDEANKENEWSQNA